MKTVLFLFITIVFIFQLIIFAASYGIFGLNNQVEEVPYFQKIIE